MQMYAHIQVCMRISSVPCSAIVVAESGLISLWISTNGAFVRSKETNSRSGILVMKQLQMYPKTTAAHFNKHFTEVLRSR